MIDNANLPTVAVDVSYTIYGVVYLEAATYAEANAKAKRGDWNRFVRTHEGPVQLTKETTNE